MEVCRCRTAFWRFSRGLFCIYVLLYLVEALERFPVDVGVFRLDKRKALMTYFSTDGGFCGFIACNVFHCCFRCFVVSADTFSHFTRIFLSQICQVVLNKRITEYLYLPASFLSANELITFSSLCTIFFASFFIFLSELSSKGSNLIGVI